LESVDISWAGCRLLITAVGHTILKLWEPHIVTSSLWWLTVQTECTTLWTMCTFTFMYGL